MMAEPRPPTAVPHSSTEPGVWQCVIDGVLYGSDAEVAVWIRERLGMALPTAVPFIAFGIIEGEQMVGGAMFWNYYAGAINDISITVAVTDDVSVKRAAIERILEYPFGQLKLPRITAYIDPQNTRAVDQALLLGFKLEGRLRHAAATGGDIGVFGLLASECAFWPPRTAS